MNGVQFVEPLWLLAGALACGALAWTWRRYDARQRAALAVFASPHLHAHLTASFSAARRAWKRGLFLAAIAFLFVALARPQAGFRWEDVKRRGIEVIFAVDTSRSMLTPDMKPDRLTRAKLAVQDFVNHLDGDGVGLVAFAGNAFLQSPVTLDYDAFNESLNAIDTTIIPRGGTDIASAIRETEAALVNRPSTDKILILLTDGEDLEGHAVEAASAAAKDGLKIYAVGVGSANGDLIPLPADQGGGFVKDEAGRFVKSRLDEAGLKAIAEATGGLYAPLGAQGQGLEHIYQQALAPLTRHDLASRRQKVYTERFQWPLAVSLALLLLSTLVGTRRRGASAAAPAHASARTARTLQSAAAIVAVVLLPLPARASSATAEKAYKQGDFAAAQREYAAAAERDPKKPDLQFNAGTAAYKAGRFEQAADAFQKALRSEPSADARRLTAQEDAYYDLGNAMYRSGQKTEESNTQQTIQTWERAVKTYDAALQLRANDADAKFNRDFVQRKLDALKKKQQQQQQNQQNSQNQKQDQKDKNQQGQQAGQQKDQQQANSGSKPDQQKQPGQQGQQRQQGQQGQQVQPPAPAKGQPQGNARGQGGADQRKDAWADVDAQRQPGQMTKEEARNLLDSLRNEERRLPAAPSARSGEASNKPDQPLRNW